MRARARARVCVCKNRKKEFHLEGGLKLASKRKGQKVGDWLIGQLRVKVGPRPEGWVQGSEGLE